MENVLIIFPSATCPTTSTVVKIPLGDGVTPSSDGLMMTRPVFVPATLKVTKTDCPTVLLLNAEGDTEIMMIEIPEIEIGVGVGVGVVVIITGSTNCLTERQAA